MFPIFVPKCLVKASADFVFCEYRKQKPGAMDRHRLVLLLLYVSALELIRNAAVVAQIREKRLAFFQNSKCTYSYELAVHTARGSKSTESDGYQLYALVSTLNVFCNAKIEAVHLGLKFVSHALRRHCMIGNN